MLKLDLSGGDRPLQRILCLGAHCDDIEIGCGGTLLRLLKGGRELDVTWVVFTSDETRAEEARSAAGVFLEGAAKRDVTVHGFRDGFLPQHWAQVKEIFERIKRETAPDVVFTHYRNDLHQDHRIVSELTWNTFRDNLILEYEIPKFDGDLGAPNAFAHLDEGLCKRKTAAILQNYRSQADRAWFSEETFLSLMRLRGVEANAPGKYAEGFYSRKLILA
jgi:LmbE family N-acetylglucosaminyl deacetylase